MAPQIFSNIEFFFLLPFIFLLVGLAKRTGYTGFRLALLAISVLLIVSLPTVANTYLLFLAGVVVVSYGFVLCAIKLRGKSTTHISTALNLLFLLVCFSLVKLYSWLQEIPWLNFTDNGVVTSLLPGVGLAYILVKSYSVFVDAKTSKVKELSIIDYALFLLYFPTFLSGPIERYKGWVEAQKKAVESKIIFLDWKDNLPRFVLGAFKSFVLSPLLFPYLLVDLGPRDYSDSWALYLGAVLYYWFEYLNFSGYCDMAISTSKTFGIKISENFNYPFLATSLSNMWRRWHMSLANWLRDYIYYPLAFRITVKIGADKKYKQAFSSATAIFLTFIICGVWHGNSYGVLFFGVASGLALAIESCVEIYCKKPTEKFLQKSWLLRNGYVLGARVWTFHIASLTFAPVLLSNKKFVELFKYLT